MNVVVTGHLGFVGSQLKQVLEDRKHTVYGIDKEYLDDPNWQEILTGFMTGANPDVVFHVGACSDTLEQDVNYMMDLNYESTKIIVDYCVQQGVPIIYSSSAANYGAEGSRPSNLYGWSKYCGEGYVVKNGGIALRYFNVYGPGEHNKGRMASVAYQMFTKAQNGEEVFLFPKNPRRDFVYIKDVVEANIHAHLHYNSLARKYYDVGSGHAESFESMLNFMEIDYDYVGSEHIPEGYQFFTCSDKNKWLPGWTPQYNLERGIKDYRQHLGGV